MSIERAISIRQPFVELILRGSKTEEYRSKPTKIRERVYLYASLQPFDSEEEWTKVERQPGELPVGRILGSVEIVDCRQDLDGDGYAYVLRNPVRLARPLKPVNQPQPVFWRPQFDRGRAPDPQIGTSPHATTKVSHDQKVRRAATARPPRTDRKCDPTLEPDAALAAIIGAGPLPRSKIVSTLWAYIEKNNLQDQENRRMVHADAKLRRLFGKNHVSLFEMAGLIGQHVR